ncbi:putative quinol monooxygenase [Neobacillus sp. BF23-41]|uniref:putative quinol monooxygenase n=1 Tax=Neobacillus sp. BF23-41 TaxID=3240280 RepID=UPI0034E3949C
MIIIHAHFKVDLQNRQAFLDQANLVAEPSQAEEGNISYEYFENPIQPNTFVFVEKWQDHAAINVHEATAHFQNFVNLVPGILSEPIQVQLFDAREIKG